VILTCYWIKITRQNIFMSVLSIYLLICFRVFFYLKKYIFKVEMCFFFFFARSGDVLYISLHFSFIFPFFKIINCYVEFIK
jgi:hypothetical protein